MKQMCAVCYGEVRNPYYGIPAATGTRVVHLRCSGVYVLEVAYLEEARLEKLEGAR